MKKVLVLTGGGDCQGLNAVIRGIVKRASQEPDWQVWGCRDSFDGLLRDELDIFELTEKSVEGIHVQGGTILGTTNKGGPFAWPVQQADGSWTTVDRSDEMIQKMKDLGIEAVINIGGDGSQRISQKLFEKGVNIIGVPKTIDNDLSATDLTFGFQTAVQIATDAIDKLVTTATSHNRVLILEVMGRDAGFIALHSAIAGGAEVCIIPEIPYHIDKIIERIDKRYHNGRGFCNIVVAEGAKSSDGKTVGTDMHQAGYNHIRLGGIGEQLKQELIDAGLKHDVRVTVLGHIQRGGTPTALDRVLASQFGTHAFDLVLEGKFGHMVALHTPNIVAVPLVDALKTPKRVNPNSDSVRTARGLGISFGD